MRVKSNVALIITDFKYIFFAQNLKYDEYVRSRVCPSSYRRLHEFIFFHPNIRKLNRNNLDEVKIYRKFQVQL